MKGTSGTVQVKDKFRALPEYCVEPLEIVAIGLKLGMAKFDRCRELAQERGVGEFAVIGNCGIQVMLNAPEDSRPPEGWLHEFVKIKYLAQARIMVTDG